MGTDEILRDTILKINLSELRRNLSVIKEAAGNDVGIMAVVKANAYGHGAVRVAQALMEGGADYLAVATLPEALELRAAFPDYPIMIMGHTPDRLLSHVVRRRITQTVFSYSQAAILNEIAMETGTSARIQIKVDTGFHRLGCAPSEEYKDEILRMSRLEHLDAEGIFSHLALAGDAENRMQFMCFQAFIRALEAEGCRLKYQHISDSIAFVDYPEYRLNMVRIGALLYGMRGYHKGFLPVEQVMTFETAVSQLHHIPAGEGVSYDFLWRATRDSTLATLPFGYADGYPRNLRGKGYVVINGRQAPIVGVICMDQCIADVTDVPEVYPGVKAVIYGDGADGSMTVDMAANLSDTNKNDILSKIAPRVQRVYLD